MPSMKFTVRSLVALMFLFPSLAKISQAIAQETTPETQSVTIRFAAKVGDRTFSCGSNYHLGNPATNQTLSDFRFYISEVALIDETGKTVPVTLEQNGKWQHQSVALLNFENKTGACTNGTVEIRDRIVGTVPKGNYTALKFSLGIPFELNHEDATLALSPLNLTGLWWNWRLGYKFARIDLQSSTTANSKHKQHQHEGHGGTGNSEGAASGFPIHLGSTGCQGETTSEKPASCSNANRASVILTDFDPVKNVVVADLERLVNSSNLERNQPKTAPGCMSEPNDNDCTSIMTNLGLSFKGKSATDQTFFRVE
jgi:uncharacterized repeat protein (TIGR04052 family)